MCRGGRGRGTLPKYNKMAGLDMKSSVKELFEILTVLHLGKRKRKKESALRMKLRYKLKVGGLLVCLSHFCWRPRILLYNGLSTFFITI